MIVSIHQPDFFPWLGVFNKIIKSDIFIVYNSCRKDSKLGWTKRVKIISGQSTQWLGFSVVKVSRDNLGLYPNLFEHRIKNFEEDKITHLRIIQAQYHKAPAFEEIYPFLIELYRFKTDRLTVFNLNVIQEICNKLDIHTTYYLSSNMNIKSTSNEANIEMTKKVGGSVYLSGDGSTAYINENLFINKGVVLNYTNFEHPVYPQFNTLEFIPGLSVIDVLMNLGFEGTKQLLIKQNV